ncbi:3'-5' exonuclease [Streptomyces sp. NPDC088106]|uniref:5-methylcytosine restriction system specificity protein McrC n=1 Tax=Streptomyces sp. NPDC088106 TaxID=3154867 RepID=UPI0034233E08
MTVRVAPKVSIARLFFLLGYTLDPRRSWRDGEVEVAEHRDLLPALAHAVERQVDRALRQGLLQGYRATEESALVVRGRIREAEQIRRRSGAMLPVEVAYDDVVRLATMHAMKGLEFRSVAVLGVTAGAVPFAREVTPTSVDALQRDADLLRERCLLFVACTRAREALAVSWSGSASSFVPRPDRLADEAI